MHQPPSMMVLQAEALFLDGEQVVREPVGPLDIAVRRHLNSTTPGGLVVLGPFGAGKSALCRRIAGGTTSTRTPCTIVPLALVGRAPSIAEGLIHVIGRTRLDEAVDGQRVLLLDGLDEVPEPDDHDYHRFFVELIEQVGPRWVMTSRPGHFRTAFERADDQADSLGMSDVSTLEIQPIPKEAARELLTALPRGSQLLRSVTGLQDLATSPLLLQITRAALPYIEPGRPIDAWGLFDAWLRYELHTGRGHDDVLRRLVSLAWQAFQASGFSTETMTFSLDMVKAYRLPQSLRRALMVTELGGRVRFGHRSVFEYLLAAHIAPLLADNQGCGPDHLSGLRITDATRAFLVGRVPPMPVELQRDRVRIPRGNFVSGGPLNPDERYLRIAHLPSPVWISRTPVTNAEWAKFLERTPDHRQDAHYLAHWGRQRRAPDGKSQLPVYNIWPEDADRYARHVKARLPSADEWEKAVRGIDGRRWPWGDHWRPGFAATAELSLKHPVPVRALGAHGPSSMFSAIGGVFEYTASSWRDRAERGRVVMGGCYTHPFATARASLRLSHKLSGNLKAGLRLAWDVE